MVHYLMFHSVALALALLVVTGAQAKRFELKDKNGKACILMDAEFEIYLSLEKEGEFKMSFDYTDQSGGVITDGTCGQELTLQISERFNWTLKFEGDANNVNISFGYEIDFTRAEHINVSSVIILENANSWSLSYPDSCYGPGTSSYVLFNEDHYTVRSTSTVSYLKLQAFDVENDKFSHATTCGAPREATPNPITTTIKPSSTTLKASGLVSSSFVVLAGLAMTLAAIFV